MLRQRHRRIQVDVDFAAALDLAISEAIARTRDALSDMWGVEDVTFDGGPIRADGGYICSIVDVAGSSASGCHACEVEIRDGRLPSTPGRMR